jgi:hypothetical protein
MLSVFKANWQIVQLHSGENIRFTLFRNEQSNHQTVLLHAVAMYSACTKCRWDSSTSSIWRLNKSTNAICGQSKASKNSAVSPRWRAQGREHTSLHLQRIGHFQVHKPCLECRWLNQATWPLIDLEVQLATPRPYSHGNGPILLTLPLQRKVRLYGHDWNFTFFFYINASVFESENFYLIFLG